MDYAAKNALQERFGGGHFGTVAAHVERFKMFVNYCKELGIKDARNVDINIVRSFVDELKDRVAKGEISEKYSVNVVSSINICLEAMKGNKELWVSASKSGLHVSTVRTEGLGGAFDRENVRACAEKLREMGMKRAAAVVELTRDFGMRVKEACLQDLRRIENEAEKYNKVDIREGTKGGRGRDVERWVPAKGKADCIGRAKSVLGAGERNLTDGVGSLKDLLQGEIRQARGVLKSFGIERFHDLRAAYACERYQQLTGRAAPIMRGGGGGGGSIRLGMSDRQAREQIAKELGHNRVDVLKHYLGKEEK